MRNVTYNPFTPIIVKINNEEGDISVLTSLTFRKALMASLTALATPEQWLEGFIPLAVKATRHNAKHLLDILVSAAGLISDEPRNFRNKFNPDEKALARGLLEAIRNFFPVEAQNATSQHRSTYGRRPHQPQLFQLQPPPQPAQKDNSSVDPSLREALAMFRHTFPGATT